MDKRKEGKGGVDVKVTATGGGTKEKRKKQREEGEKLAGEPFMSNMWVGCFKEAQVEHIVFGVGH